MNWWKPLAGLSVALLAFVAVGALVGLVALAAGNPAALAVVGVIALVVVALSGAGSAPNRWLSNPYWGN